MASNISATQVQDLRQRTGAGMMECKKALLETEGNIEKAVEYLRKKGISKAEKKADREAKQGSVISYVHGGGRIGVLVEINCETDFVARNDDFQEFAKNIAMHVAASNPRFLAREAVTQEILENEKKILLEQVKEMGKPEHVAEKIVTGKLEKFYEENCLLEQPYIKNPDTKVKDYVKEAIAKLGENIIIRRYARFELGQGES